VEERFCRPPSPRRYRGRSIDVTRANDAATHIEADCPARLQERGARYHGQNDFVRHRIFGLDLWMSSRADEIRPDLSTATLRSAKNRGIKS